MTSHALLLRTTVLLLGTVLLAACAQAESLGAPPARSAAQLDEPCPLEADEVLAGQDATTRVPADAVRARLCVHSNGIDVGPGPEQPSDPRLLDGQQAAELAAGYDDLQAFGTDQLCTADAGPTVTVLFGYADGSAAAVATDLFGCGTSRVVAGQEPRLIDRGTGLREELRRLATP